MALNSMRSERMRLATWFRSTVFVLEPSFSSTERSTPRKRDPAPLIRFEGETILIVRWACALHTAACAVAASSDHSSDERIPQY